MTCLLTVSCISTPRDSCLNDSTVLKEEVGGRDQENGGVREWSELSDLKANVKKLRGKAAGDREGWTNEGRQV